MSEAMTAHCSAPPFDPANRLFFLLSAIGLMARSTTLVSSATRPTPRKSVRPAKRVSA